MDAPVEDWPVCDCLVAFYSTGFPSDKAEAYVKLRRPYALNNLEMQDVLHDRRRVRSFTRRQKLRPLTWLCVCRVDTDRVGTGRVDLRGCVAGAGHCLHLNQYGSVSSLLRR